METKEAIEFLEEAIDCAKKGNLIPALQECDKEFNKVIALLKRGEKYEKMWDELVKKYGNYWNVCDDIEAGYLCTIMNSYEQKYFPKEK